MPGVSPGGGEVWLDCSLLAPGLFFCWPLCNFSVDERGVTINLRYNTEYYYQHAKPCMMDISEGIEIYNEIKEILMNDIGTEDNVPSSISITQLIFGLMPHSIVFGNFHVKFSRTSG